MDDSLDFDALVKRVLRPAHPALAAVSAAVTACADAREAWETLAVRGLISDEWFSNDARWFRAGPAVLEAPLGFVRGHHDEGSQVSVWRLDENGRRRASFVRLMPRSFRAAGPLRDGDFVVQCGRFEIRAAEVQPWSSFPPTVDAIVALASNVDAATTAERLAREHFGDSSHLIHWSAVDDDQLASCRAEAIEHARSTAMPRELRAVLALGYFVRGLDGDRAIEIVCPERVEAESPD